MGNINREDLRPLQNKYKTVCAVCKQEIRIGADVLYHIKIKKCIHPSCRDGNIESVQPIQRPKIWGKYTQTQFIAAAHDLNATEDTIWKCLKRVGVETTPSTYSTISTTISDIRRGTLTPEKLSEQHTDLLKKTIAAVLAGDTEPAEASQPTQAAATISKEEIQKIIDAMGYVTKEELEKQIADVKKYQPIEVIIKKVPKPAVNAGKQHYLFPTLLEYVAMGHNMWIYGPAGAGKTKAARNVAKHLDMQYYSKSCSKEMTVSSLLGYMDATGKYVRTGFRDAFEKGGLFLFDEVDKCNANVLTTFNDALDASPGDLVSFPDKMVPKSKDFIGLAGANTIGQGANRQYVSSMQQDAAALDRFTFLEWGYDEALELHISADETWTKLVQAYRTAADTLGIRHIISPRASLKGGQALKHGRPLEEIERMILWKGLDEASIEKIKKEVSRLDNANVKEVK